MSCPFSVDDLALTRPGESYYAEVRENAGVEMPQNTLVGELSSYQRRMLAIDPLLAMISDAKSWMDAQPTSRPWPTEFLDDFAEGIQAARGR